MLLPLLLYLLLARLSAADIPNTITISTECKTCPYNLCPNTKIYTSKNPDMNLTCWTAGSEIVGDTTWLKTTDNCYVTQWDIDEYAGEYTEDLPYCGYIEPEWTHGRGRTKYYSECYYKPYIQEVPIKNYKYNINLDLTCVARNASQSPRSTFLGKSKWYKTISDCFVHETTLFRVRDEEYLDECGPLVISAHATDRLPEPTPTREPDLPPPTTVVPTTTAPPSGPSTTISFTAPIPTPSNATVARSSIRPRGSARELNRRFLYTTTIGEEYVNCTTSSVFSDRAHGVKRVYEFNQTVIPQCGTRSERQIMLFTTDFCWIRDDECWERLIDSLFRGEQFPRCEQFVDEVS